MNPAFRSPLLRAKASMRLTVSPRCTAGIFFEHLVEIMLVLIPDPAPDLAHWQIAVGTKQLLRFFDPGGIQIIHKRITGHLLEEVADVIGMKLHQVRQMIERKIVHIVHSGICKNPLGMRGTVRVVHRGKIPVHLTQQTGHLLLVHRLQQVVILGYVGLRQHRHLYVPTSIEKPLKRSP